ncbi:unnamed protein product, partial [Laminaria digitata]
MTNFEPEKLRALRKAKQITAAELARRMNTSPAQVHRLEKGLRRLTVDALINYCDALDINLGSLFASNVWVPVTGVIDSDFEVHPLTPHNDNRTLAPLLTPERGTIAALRWAASRRFQPMRDHIVFYERKNDSDLEIPWNKRCLVEREGGSQCLGFPIRTEDSAHIDFGSGPVEFDVSIRQAWPVIAVMPPF